MQAIGTEQDGYLLHDDSFTFKACLLNLSTYLHSTHARIAFAGTQTKSHPDGKN
jgi:hypothetical protein